MMRKATLGLAAAALLLSTSLAAAEPKYGPGASDTQIKIGQTVPLSGPASAFGTHGHVVKAYFDMISAKGGINGRKIEMILADNGFNPARAVEQTRRLVEEEQILAEVGTVGTVPNSATQQYLNNRKVPQLLISAGGSRFNDPENFPWTVPFYPSFDMEGAIYGQHILQTRPDAKIAVLYQSDDYGRDFLHGLHRALGDRAGEMIVREESYQLTDPTVDSQIVALRESGADTFLQFTTPKFAAQAIRRIADLEWEVTHYIVSPASSIQATLVPAGVDASKGLISAKFSKEPHDPTWANDQDIKDYLAFMAEWLPNENPANFLAVSGYVSAQMMAHVLEQAGDDLTRENLIKVATNLDVEGLPLILPGIRLTNNPQNYALYHQMQLAQFDGESWRPMGEVIDVRGE